MWPGKDSSASPRTHPAVAGNARGAWCAVVLAPLVAALLVAALLVAAPWFALPQPGGLVPGAGPLLAAAPMAQAEVVAAGVTFRVDVADTPSLQAQGLAGRKALGPREGMLFVYTQRERHSFWMRGMLMSIDIIWLDNRRVVHIEHKVPPPKPGTPQESLPTYQPRDPANFVLEIAAGRAKALGLQVGDRVEFRFNVR